MDIRILTLFPGMFHGPFDHSVVGRAANRGLVRIQVGDIRDHTHDNHHTADDYQYGGGPGMVMKPGPIFEAVEDALSDFPGDVRDSVPVVLLSPQGRRLDQNVSADLASKPGLVLICGHYEGVDERVREALATDDVSIGDYVLTGGELAAMVVTDAVVRLLPGVVGSPESVLGDSITSGLLQHPVYTRPPVYRDLGVPAGAPLRRPRRGGPVAKGSGPCSGPWKRGRTSWTRPTSRTPTSGFWPHTAIAEADLAGPHERPARLAP